MNGVNALDKLAALIKGERHALLARWRQQVRELPSAQHLDAPTLNDHLPQLIDELAAALRARSGQTKASPPAHGLQRVADSTFRFTLPPRQGAVAAPPA